MGKKPPSMTGSLLSVVWMPVTTDTGGDPCGPVTAAAESAYESAASVPSSVGTPTNVTLPETGKSVVIDPCGSVANALAPTSIARSDTSRSGPSGFGAGGCGTVVTV